MRHEKQYLYAKNLAQEILFTMGIFAMIALLSLSKCCFQYSDKEGEIHVLGNCNESQEPLIDACEHVLDPEHQTITETMREAYPERPDSIMVYVEHGHTTESGETESGENF